MAPDPPRTIQRRRRFALLNKVANLNSNVSIPRRQRNHLQLQDEDNDLGAFKSNNSTTEEEETTVASSSASSTSSFRSLLSTVNDKLQQASLSTVQSSHRIVRSIRHARRKVSFADDSENEYYDNTLMCEEDVMEELWYSDFEYTMFQSKVAVVCARISRNERGPHNPLSYEYVVSSIFDGCCQCSNETDIHTLPDKKQQFKLVQQLKGSPARLGIERALVHDILVDRYDRQRRMLEMIQLIDVATTSESNKNKMSSNVKKQERIRRACMNASLPSRLFARYMGEANAASEWKDEDDNKDENGESQGLASVIKN